MGHASRDLAMPPRARPGAPRPAVGRRRIALGLAILLALVLGGVGACGHGTHWVEVGYGYGDGCDCWLECDRFGCYEVCDCYYLEAEPAASEVPLDAEVW